MDSDAAAYGRRHARILLLADENRDDGGRTDSDIASILGIGVSTVERVRRRQKNRKPRSLDGAGEVRLVALACSQPPEGQVR